MDAEGYLPIALIASFHRVQSMTQSNEVILSAINDSDKLELGSNMRVGVLEIY